MPAAVIDLTEMVRLAMQRPERSPLFRAWEEGLFTWVAGEEILAEFVEVTNRPRLQRMIRPAVRDALVAVWRARARLVVPAAQFPRCRDPGDDIIIATAVEAGADYIVTMDRDLLEDEALRQALTSYGVHIATPKEFLEDLAVSLGN